MLLLGDRSHPRYQVAWSFKIQQDKLADLESRLDKILTPERRRELELLAIERELAGGTPS